MGLGFLVFLLQCCSLLNLYGCHAWGQATITTVGVKKDGHSRNNLGSRSRLEPFTLLHVKNEKKGRYKCSESIGSTLYGSISPGTSPTTSLAGRFLVQCDSNDNSEFVWSLVTLDDLRGIDEAAYPTKEARAWASLCSVVSYPQKTFILNADFPSRSVLNISVSGREVDNEVDIALLEVLGRIFAQWVLSIQFQRNCSTEPIEAMSIRIFRPNKRIDLDAGSLEIFMGSSTSMSTMWNQDDCGLCDDVVRSLFDGFDSSQPSELVEMVDQRGVLLGIVPRTLVHKHNLLHRGIGLFVTKDYPIQLCRQQQQPDVYCHQRTASKRIFPFLYDMFVGGVSLAREDAAVTARREVAEELGLVAALDGIDEGQACRQLSECLLRCVVCTGYNRCVVDLFSYTMDTSKENVVWQAEEVAWGSFVPYDILEAAADESIQRIVAAPGGWPGRYPTVRLSGKELDSKSFGDWKSWDFVPDGLLVWEAWCRAIHHY